MNSRSTTIFHPSRVSDQDTHPRFSLFGHSTRIRRISRPIVARTLVVHQDARRDVSRATSSTPDFEWTERSLAANRPRAMPRRRATSHSRPFPFVVAFVVAYVSRARVARARAMPRTSATTRATPFDARARDALVDVARISARDDGRERRERSFDAHDVVRVSWSPNAVVFRAFATSEERARWRREASDDEANSNSNSNSLSNSLSFRARDVTSSFALRASTWVKIPVRNIDAVVVRRVDVGGAWEGASGDGETKRASASGRLVGTVIVYLSDVDEGGETVFPRARDGTRLGAEASACARGKVGAKPREGDAFYFRSAHYNGTTDESGASVACPVIRGVMYTATMRIYDSPVVYESPVSVGGEVA